MSQTLSPSSLPVDTALSGRTRSWLLDPIRGFLRLVWIEFRRCGGYWMLPLILPLAWYLGQERGDAGVVLWFAMSIYTFQSYIVIGPLTAGLAAWLVGRDRRRRTGGLVETAPFQPFCRDLVLLQTAGMWGLVSYTIVATWYLGQGVLFATWGGPDFRYIAVGAMAIVVHSAFGGLIGRVIRGRFAVLVAVAISIVLPIGLDMYRTGDGMQPLRALSPMSLALGISNEAIAGPANGLTDKSLLWLSGILGVTLAVTALLRARSRVGVAGLALSLLVAAMGALPLLDTQGDAATINPHTAPDIAFEWSCQSGLGIEVCLHPAFEARLGDVTTTMTTLLAPITGLPGVPTTWYQSLPTENQGERNDRAGAILFWLNDQALVMSLADALFTHQAGGERNASQLVVITALAEQAGIVDPFPWPYGWPSEVAIQQGEGFYGPDETALNAFKPGFDAAVDQFMALSPEEQRAWLEANWHALRAGELTLDDMP